MALSDKLCRSCGEECYFCTPEGEHPLGPDDELKTLRARVAELEAANSEWQDKYRSERRLRDEQRDIVEAAEQRAASLQAEVERLTTTLASVSEEYARKRIEWSRALSGGADAINSLERRAVTAESALAESERKRAEMLGSLAEALYGHGRDCHEAKQPYCKKCKLAAHYGVNQRPTYGLPDDE